MKKSKVKVKKARIGKKSERKSEEKKTMKERVIKGMTKKEMKAIRDEATGELQARIAEMQAELAKERSLKSAGTRPENPGKIRKLRRTIAKYLTVINERKKTGEVKKKNE